jgi:hypothetical protein
MDRHHNNHGHRIKDIYVYPLIRNVQSQLRIDLRG